MSYVEYEIVEGKTVDIYFDEGYIDHNVKVYGHLECEVMDYVTENRDQWDILDDLSEKFSEMLGRGISLQWDDESGNPEMEGMSPFSEK